MKTLNTLDWLALILLVIGGINWGMIGLFNIDLVGTIFGEMTLLSRIVYTLVGVAALYSLYTLSSKTQSNESNVLSHP